MFITFSIFSIAYSFSNLFLNIFIWKHHSSMTMLGWFHVCSFSFIFIGFLVGAYLIKWFGSRINLMFSSFIALLLYTYLSFGSFETIIGVGVAGIINGTYIGLFFAGLNFYSIWFSTHSELPKVISLQYIISGTAQLLTPPIAGWIIYYYGYDRAFEVAILILSIQSLTSIMTPQVRIRSPYWRKSFFIPSYAQMKPLGLSASSFGFFFAFVHMSLSIFVYLFLHNEWQLGELNSIFAILSLMTYFILGRTLLQPYYRLIAVFGIIVSTVVTLSLFVPSPLTFIVFNAVISVSLPMLWVPSFTEHFQTIRELVKQSRANPLTKMMELLVFREFSLCVGRVTFFIVLIICFSFLEQQALALIIFVLCFMPTAVYVLSQRAKV